MGKLTFRRLRISRYYQFTIIRYTFQCYYTSIIKTISFRIDNGCKIWKIYILSFPNISLVLRIVNEHDLSLHLPPSANSPSVMDCNNGRSMTLIPFKFTKYFPLLLIKILWMHNILMKWNANLVNLFITHSTSFQYLGSQRN